MSQDQIKKNIAELKKIVGNLENLVGGGGGGGSTDEPEVEGFDFSKLDELLKTFTAASAKLGGEVVPASAVVIDLAERMKVVTNFSKRSKKPTTEQMTNIQKELTAPAQKLANYDKKREIPNHMKVIQGGLTAFYWPTLDTPKVWIDNAFEEVNLYGNKIRMTKIPDQQAWIVAFIDILKFNQEFVKENKFTGSVLWNFHGEAKIEEVISLLKGEKPAKKSVSSNPPPPPPPGGGQLPSSGLPLPPPPPPSSINTTGSQQKSGENDRDQMLADLNCGVEGVMAKLKPVNKNKPVDQPKPVKKASVKVVKKVEQVKEPKKYKKQANLFIENYIDQKIELEPGEIVTKSQIFVDNCKNIALIVNEKANKIMLNNCQRTNIYFKDLVSGIETVNCKALTVVCNGSCPSINIDKTDGCQVNFMSSKECEIISAKSSEMNVTYKKENEEEMEKETPIPEQFVTKWNAQKKAFETKVYESI